MGFADFSQVVTITGQSVSLNATLRVASGSEQIMVLAERWQGEAEEINETRTSENILNILPAEVIRSLPNANIADGVGRLPGVTLERDEGEGKYVQIRGTEPRLSNVTIGGVVVPSPESGVRQVRLDTVSADLVESVEINKNAFCQSGRRRHRRFPKSGHQNCRRRANHFGLRRRRIHPHRQWQTGRRHFRNHREAIRLNKRWGKLLGGTFDYNGRGIEDIEPAPIAGGASPHSDGIDLREYRYELPPGLCRQRRLQAERGLGPLRSRPLVRDLPVRKLASSSGIHLQYLGPVVTLERTEGFDDG